MEESSLRRIEKFKTSLEKLKKISELPLEKFLANYFEDVSERNLQVCVEAIMDVSRKIIASKEWQIPKSYREIVEILQQKKVIKNELAKKIQDLIGIRNIIVHFYADVKAEIIHENLKEYIQTLDGCMKVLLNFCEKNDIDP